MKIQETKKQTFAKYVSKHTTISYKRASGLYEFCTAMGLTKEEVVNKHGDLESLSALSLCHYT